MAELALNYGMGAATRKDFETLHLVCHSGVIVLDPQAYLADYCS